MSFIMLVPDAGSSESAALHASSILEKGNKKKRLYRRIAYLKPESKSKKETNPDRSGEALPARKEGTPSKPKATLSSIKLLAKAEKIHHFCNFVFFFIKFYAP